MSYAYADYIKQVSQCHPNSYHHGTRTVQILDENSRIEVYVSPPSFSIHDEVIVTIGLLIPKHTGFIQFHNHIIILTSSNGQLKLPNWISSRPHDWEAGLENWLSFWKTSWWWRLKRLSICLYLQLLRYRLGFQWPRLCCWLASSKWRNPRQVTRICGDMLINQIETL